MSLVTCHASLSLHRVLRAPEVIPGHGQIWFEADRRRKFADAFFFPAQGKQDKPQVIMRLSIVGIESQCLLVLFYGFRKLALPGQLHTKVYVLDRILWRQPNCFLELLHGFSIPSQTFEG